MQYTATAKYVHTSTRKVRLVADAIRGMNAEKALIKLTVISQHAADPISAVITSALNNAKQKNAQTDQLVLKQLDVMGGPMMKRWRAVSKGMAHGYNKRMTHIKVTLEEPEK
jgi:large subunit ribosomal protein L22